MCPRDIWGDSELSSSRTRSARVVCQVSQWHNFSAEVWWHRLLSELCFSQSFWNGVWRTLSVQILQLHLRCLELTSGFLHEPLRFRTDILEKRRKRFRPRKADEDNALQRESASKEKPVALLELLKLRYDSKGHVAVWASMSLLNGYLVGGLR